MTAHRVWLSAHFARDEFDCKDGSRAAPDHALLIALENLRGICGDRPLRIVSGYRSPGWNARVGGAIHSQHLVNRAADIPAGYATVAQARLAGFTGVGHRAGWVVHVDTRRGPRVVFND